MSQMNSKEDSLFHGDLVTSRRVIYTPSPFARQSLLYLQEAGSLQARRPHTSRRSGLRSYLFFLVESGSGTLTAGDRSDSRILLRPGDCVFLDCRQPYSHTTSSDLWRLKWVHFDGAVMNGIYEKYLERSGGPVFHPSPDNLISWQLDKIYNISVSDSYVRDMQINAALASLLTSIMELSWNPDLVRVNHGRTDRTVESVRNQESSGNPVGSFRISDVKDFIDQHYTEDTSLDELAALFHFNKYYLVRLFRARYATTIGNYRTSVRINEAKKILRFTNVPLAEAGSKVGYNDPNYFSRIFKKVEGITPGEYRKAW